MAKRTVNRKPLSVSIPDVKDYFFSQNNWKGLNDGKNPFTVDQQSFEDCKNVYVDNEGLLSSRPCIKKIQINRKKIRKQWQFGNTYITYVNELTFDENDKPVFDILDVYKNGIFEYTIQYKDSLYVENLILRDEFLYIFTIDGDIFVYDTSIRNFIDKCDAIYTPITKIYTNNIAADYESKNELTRRERYRHIYNKLSAVNFSLFKDKEINVSYNDVNTTVTAGTDISKTFMFKIQGISKNEIADDVVLGESNEGKLLVSSSERGKIYCQYNYKYDEDGKIVDVVWRVRYTSDDKTFTYYDCPSGVLGMPVISQDGTFIAVLLKDGPYALSIISNQADGSLEFSEWTNLITYNGLTNLKSVFNQYNYPYYDDINSAGLYGGEDYPYNRGVGLSCITSSQFCYMYSVAMTNNYSNYLQIVKCVDGEFAASAINNDIDTYPFVLNSSYDLEHSDRLLNYYYFRSLKNNYINIQTKYTRNALYMAFSLVMNMSDLSFYNKKLYYCVTEKSKTTFVIYQIATINDFTIYNEPYIFLEGLSNIQLNLAYFYENDLRQRVEFILPDPPSYVPQIRVSDLPDPPSLTYPAIITTDNHIYCNSKVITPNDEIMELVGVPDVTDNNVYYLDYVYWLDMDNLVLYNNNLSDNIVYIDETINNDSHLNLFFSCISNLNTIFISHNNKLYVSTNKYVSLEQDSPQRFQLYFPEINTQNFEDNICCLHPISQSEMGIFTENSLYYTQLSEQGYVYNKSRINIRCKKGMQAINTYDGKYTIFSSDRGLMALSYQDFIASTEQAVNVLSDVISEHWKHFNDEAIKLTTIDFWLICYCENKTYCYVYDFRNGSFWQMEYNSKIIDIITIEGNLRILSSYEHLYTLSNNTNNYFDDSDTAGEEAVIHWNFTSQKLHFDKPIYRKHISNIQLNTVENGADKTTFKLVLKMYRDKNYDGDISTLEYDVDTLRTFVKHCNYLKVNQLQYCLKYDDSDVIQKPLKLSNIIIKYSVTSQVR